MKVLGKFFVVLFLAAALIITGCAEKDEKAKGRKTKTAATEIEIPWDDYGYKKAPQFHLRYYYIFGDAIDKVLKGEMSWEEAIKDNTGIVEVWFKSDGGLFRLDRYIEKLGVICKSYKGDPPDTLSHNNQTYSLQERIIQKGKQFTSYTFRSGDQIGYDDAAKQAIAKNCYYEKSAYEKTILVDQRSAISLMMMGHTSGAGFGFNLPLELADVDLNEIRKASLELDKIMNPSQYKKIIEGWKAEKKIAGRAAVKDYMSPPPFRSIIGMKGFQFIDTELGIGLAGYLEGCAKSRIYPETKFKEPKLTYKALLVETTLSPDVFKSF